MSPVSGIQVVWEFRVRPGSEAAFLGLYGPDGDWTRLMAGAPGYLGTELWSDLEDPTRFLTVDRWESVAHWERFRSTRGAEYEALDRAGGELTRSEVRLGTFQSVARLP